MSASVPDTLDGLSDWLYAQIDSGHRRIIGALIRLARDVDARLAASSVALPPEFDRALSLLEAWQREEGGQDVLDRAEQLLAECRSRREGPRDRRRRAPGYDPVLEAVGIAASIVHAANYDDHDDWPEEVVLPAADLLMRAVGLDERAAVHWAAGHFSG